MPATGLTKLGGSASRTPHSAAPTPTCSVPPPDSPFRKLSELVRRGLPPPSLGLRPSCESDVTMSRTAAVVRSHDAHTSVIHAKGGVAAQARQKTLMNVLQGQDKRALLAALRRTDHTRAFCTKSNSPSTALRESDARAAASLLATPLERDPPPTMLQVPSAGKNKVFRIHATSTYLRMQRHDSAVKGKIA